MSFLLTNIISAKGSYIGNATSTIHVDLLTLAPTSGIGLGSDYWHLLSPRQMQYRQNKDSAKVEEAPLQKNFLDQR